MPQTGLNINATLYSSVNAAQPNVIGKVWSNLFKYSMLLNDPLTILEGGENSGAPIEVKRDLVGKAGSTIFFSQVAGLGGRVVRGETQLENAEDKFKFGSWSLYLDFRRYAVGWTKKLVKRLAAGRNLHEFTLEALSKHYGWQKSRERMLRFRNSAKNARNVMYAGQAGNINLLKSAHNLSTTAILDTADALQFINADPAKITKFDKSVGAAKAISEVWNYVFIAGQQTFTPLHLDSTYITAINSIAASGMGNQNFTGRLLDWKGQALYGFTAPNGDVIGPVGSPLRPFAYVGANTGVNVGVAGIPSGAAGTPVVIYGSRETNEAGTVYDNNPSYEYFVDFPGFAYNYDDQETTSGVAGGIWDFPTTSTDYYILIYNAATDKKFGFASYRNPTAFTANANTLQTYQRAVSGTPLAGVDWLAAPWVGRMTDSHPVGALIVPANALGVPIEFVLVVGAGSMACAYGEEYTPLEGSGDYGMKLASGYECDFGNAIAKNSRSEPAKYGILCCAARYASWGLPTIT